MLARALFSLFVLVATASCQLDDRVDLLRILRVQPGSASAGDRITIWGEGFPEGRPAAVVFQGDVFRPGVPPERDVRLVALAKPGARNSVDFLFDRDLERRVSGSGNSAVHSTFRGDLRVAFEPTARGVASIAGTFRGAVLDVLPSVTDPELLGQRSSAGAGTLSFVGATAKAEATRGGIELASLDPDGPFFRAGLRAGDRLVEFDGVSVVSVSDLRPVPGERIARVVVERDGRPLPPLPVDVHGVAPPGAHALVGGGALVLGVCLLLGALSSPLGRVLGLLIRLGISGRGAPSGRRSIAASRPFLRLIGADAGVATGVAVCVVLAVIAAAFTSLALGRSLLSREVDLVVGVLVPCVALLSARTCDGGFIRSRGWSLRGAGASMVRTLACLVPALVALIGVVFSTGRFVLEEIVADQGGVPWRWGAMRNPGSAVLFLVLLATAVPESAYRGIVSIEGLEPTTLPRSTSRTLVRVAEWTYLFAICGVACAVFLGGWRVPTVTFMVQESSRRLSILGVVLFFAKFATLAAAVLVARRAALRLFLEDVAGLYGRWATAWALSGACLAVGWAAGFEGAKTQVPGDLLGYAATALAALLACVGAAVWLRGPRANATISGVNPWL